ncbi:subclass B1 metallo-beta-lactamase [Cellulophaga baltica]|uniref:subclass B1 metallo-beta-lactamase n=1 Tax=Cellulophaga TaxID=104264 RepID=UPI001C07741F|nr:MULTISPECIES: subclass B1 metallo-beta-lactamase [Cellulophaga]MBU2995080.1 subclass B1 metallo-beta-lactamase [Cellulophaga baltica]MDO6766475.1 subclass B1 metallo-beta-lactamase [Cellulophaga sp. 1_MG-2023]
MKQLFILILICTLLLNCKSQESTITYKTSTLTIKPISKNVFIHITYLDTNDFGKVACNGMIYMINNEAIVFDTPTNSNVSNELITWITKAEKHTIKAVVINHFHLDCLGGLEVFHQLNIPSYASNKTIALAKINDFTLPQNGFETTLNLNIGDKEIINTYFGEAHTKDNIVSYIPSEQILFGGCQVKTLGANRGYTGDANTEEWSNTIKKIKVALPTIKTVIPGHGKIGDATLLDYTSQLFK